ncbi:Zinc fingers and homeoboxes protein 2 [Bagarius yarrelli]|uniref:Zinc fingers and homeoboxes protein 2 n=1 Tax=Bagarius yarrelli TaxID=175774 RepID=A0A556U681_BAGYA|nr:Zinc fingers and homeoboxes protein 2 [Bagarius yarrelli]
MRVQKHNNKIVALDDLRQEELEELNNQREELVRKHKERVNGLNNKILEKENELAMLNCEIAELGDVKSLQQQQLGRIAELEQEVMSVHCHHSETLNALKDKCFNEKERCKTESKHTLREIGLKANNEASLCLLSYIEKMSEENDLLHKELQHLIQRARALRSHQQILQTKRRQLLLEKENVQQVAMQQCEHPRQQQRCEENRKLEVRLSVEAEKEARDSEASDAYECRICGFKAKDVCSLSQHLHSVHPITAPACSSSAKDDSKDKGDQTSEGQKSPAAGNSEFSEGSMSSSPMDSEETSINTCNAENQVQAAQKDTVKNTPAAKNSQSISPASILPQRKPSSSSKSTKGSQSEDAASSGTSGLNQTHLVCLPLVSEGLKLVWVRSEQVKELDAVSELVEAFNAFPYPTEQEASALARRCSLSAERVKVWFMMQRVRYGISWADDDIRQTRLKLRRLQRISLREGGEGEEEDFLACEERTPEAQLQVVNQAPVTDVFTGYAHYTPQPVFPQDEASDLNSRQNSNVPQYSNGLETFVQQQTANQRVANLQNAFVDRDLAQLPTDLNHLPPLEPKAESSSTYQALAKSAVVCGPPITQQRKKSKAQLMALRRSFVQKNWPSEAEVQRLQRVTGLGRHEIRKWFADSRYQLRRSGRSWLAELAKSSQSQESLERLQQQLNSDEFPEDGENSGAGLDFELDVNMDDYQGPLEDDVSESDTRKEEQSDEPSDKDGQNSVKQDRRENASVPSPSPASSSPSPSLLQGWNPSLGPEPNLRKKTWEQLNMLRQSFLHCQWPTSEDYTVLQQKTGLTRTEIVQWYGDTRYHIKHSNLRWVHPDDRERVRASVLKQQKRAGKGPRSRRRTGGTDPSVRFRAPQTSNGTEASEEKSWDKLYKTASSVLPGGEF